MPIGLLLLPDDESRSMLPIHMNEKILSHPAFVGIGKSKFPIILIAATDIGSIIRHIGFKESPILIIETSERIRNLEDVLESLDKPSVIPEMMILENPREMLIPELILLIDYENNCVQFIPEIARRDTFWREPVRAVLQLPYTYG